MIAKISLVLVVFLGVALAAVEVPGTLIRMKSVRNAITSSRSPPTCDGVNYYSICYDCNKILTCIGKQKGTQKECFSIFPTRPYCSEGVCSSTRTCPVPSAALDCTGVGTFPDPFNCSRYHYCEAADQESSIYACPPNYVFNPDSGLCKTLYYNQDCMTAKCDATKSFGTYGTSKTYFAICTFTVGVLETVNMAKCPNSTIFDTVNGSGCKVTCTQDGNIANPFDPSHATYYQCYTSGYNKVASLKTCPDGKAFDVSVSMCTAAAFPTTAPTAAPETSFSPISPAINIPINHTTI